MPILCCGVKYSKKDIDTYWCFDTYTNKPALKKTVGQDAVTSEITDVVLCKKCGAVIVLVSRYGKTNGKNKLLEAERMSGAKAEKYLAATAEIRKKQPVKCPVQKVPPYSRGLDYVYGKILNDRTQRARYLNESGWADTQKIVNEVISRFSYTP